MCLFYIFFFIGVFISPIHVAFAQSSNELPNSYHIEGVPLVDQGSRPWCGAGSVTMVLQYWSVDITLEEVGEAIDNEEDGCYTYEITEYLATFNFKIYELNDMDDIKDWIYKDHPIIVLQWMDESKQSGHYRVVTGFDKDHIYVNDPNGYTDKISYELFLLLWTKYNEYGVTISPVKTYITDPYSNRTVKIKV